MNLSSKGIILLTLLLFHCFCHAKDHDHETDRIIPVVNPLVKQDTISKQGLNAIFKMRLHKWKDGTPVTVFVLGDDNPTHQRFCKEILNVFPHQMRRIWNRLVFSGTGQAPIELKNSDEMIRKLISTPGAIGYLGSDQLKQPLRALTPQTEGNH